MAEGGLRQSAAPCDGAAVRIDGGDTLLRMTRNRREKGRAGAAVGCAERARFGWGARPPPRLPAAIARIGRVWQAAPVRREGEP